MPSGVSVEAERQWLVLGLAQQALWLDAKLSVSSVYQLGGWARIAAQVDEGVLRQSVSLLMARHDGLRLRVDDDLPRQWIDESVEPPIDVIEIIPAGDPDEAFQALMEERFSSALPLGDRPLFRIELIRAGQNLSYLLWRFHHLIADSASVSITLSHWFNAYEALATGTPRELAPASSYLKTLAADAAYLDSASYHKDLAYWTSRFDPLPPPLIADMEPKPSGLSRVPLADWRLEGAEFLELRNAAKDAGVTAQRALFALFTLTLGRRYGQLDLVAGIALHRRDLANRHALGMMAGVIPVRCVFEPYWSLAEAVQAFSEHVDKDLRHQRLPVDILSRALGLSGTGRAGLFEAAMSYIPAERGELAIEGLPVQMGAAATKEASPISLHVIELATGECLAVRVAVNPDFLNAGEARTLLGLFREAKDRFVGAPDARLEELPTTDAVERSLVIEEWNRTDAKFEEETLDSLFAAQVRGTPDAVAVVGRSGAEMTYAELDVRSTRLAKYLASRGVCPETVVGVRMERSSETIVALLAILKAGGVYLPLDPAYPDDRLAYIASDANALLVLDSIEGLESDADFPKPAGANRLAYIVYTSGTTGRPKGVAVPHSAAVNLAFARRACHDPLGPGDRVLAAISVGFDVSVGQLLLPLLSGATVIVASDLRTMSPSEFWAMLAERRVSHINSVPSFVDSILEAAPPAGTLALKRLMLGGEALSGALVGRIQHSLPGVEVVNMYGPTESCIDATFHTAAASDLSAAVLPIGRPLANYRAYVLDSMLDPAGIGVSGELFLGGAGLARGYVGAPELTAERFVADPFSGRPGARLYRTGDRARWRADGRIEFLGRVDRQVKIRGFRVEPAEIAVALLAHPGVAQAVVVPYKGPAGAMSGLAAYVVPRSNDAIPATSELRAYLAERLPDYMVPSAFVPIGAIPLGRNGKLDENALPPPDAQEGGHIVPRTPTEETVARLFADVLGLERCGATDHFFELGGHSLLATSLVSKMRAGGMELPLRAIFETPTVEALARRIDALPPPTGSAEPLLPQTRPAAIPLSFPQERIWFVDRLRQDSSYNIPIGFEMRGALRADAVRHALEAIAARHEALRTRIALREGKPVQEIAAPAPLEIAYRSLSRPDARHAVAELARHRFDLASDLPFEVRLMRVDPETHILAAVIHHAAFDGWSAGVFLAEFAALYKAFVESGTNPLPALTIQYPDFALWQRGQDYDASLSFWLETLHGAPARLELPGGEPPADAPRPLGAHAFTLEAPLQQALLKLANENRASLFMLLHAAFALLLARWSGQDDVVIGTVTANRGRAEFEPLIGCFVNTLPLRVKLEAGEPFARLLERVKAADLAAYAHQDLPFERLVEALHPDRSLRQTPIFQVMLVLQNAPLPAAALPGLTMQPLAMDAETAKFDLTLSMTEQKSGLDGTFEYARNRFEPAAIERLSRQFERLLRAVTADPAQDTSQIDLLDPAERSLGVHEWNRTDESFPHGTLDTLFSAQARRTPHTLAVIGRDGARLTYAELDSQSTQIARGLAAHGVVPGSVVGVQMERSTETIVAFLAILKAGGTYLPLDPAYPAERLAYMTKNSGAALVIESLDGFDGDAELPELDDPSRLAYIVYTSGTTGKPKGVAVSHSAPVNLAYARRACHDPIGPGDRILAAISVGFDVSIGQLLLPLLSGAAVVIASDIKTMGAGAFWTLLTERQVTHINSVPSFVDSILDAAPPALTLSLKRLMLGGEALSGALVERIQKALPGVEVVNMYGPTEACIDATFHPASAADFAAPVLPIGRPLSNYRAYVLDGAMRPVGVGVVGELYVGGAGLAHSYVGAPELTAERFVDDPFAGDPGGRLYRTGDRARWRSDGRLEFLGRVDEQIKIRGFRVEPAEIEAQLRRQNGVRDAAVVAHDGGSGVRLIAYYTSDEAADLEALRAAMASALPDYMIPAAFVKLDRLPLSANGKLDRKALPEPGQSSFVARAFEPPAGEAEERMAALWAEILNVGRVGRFDNFFELGGHSLLAVTLIERMQRQGFSADVRALFTEPTIAGLAAKQIAGSHPALAPPNGIQPGCEVITPEVLPLAQLTTSQIGRIAASLPGGAASVQDIYALAPLQEGILFQHLVASAGDPYLTPFLLAFDSRARVDAFLHALNLVVRRHDALRTFMVWKDLDRPVQVVLREAPVPVEEVSVDGADALLERYDPKSYRLNLGTAPLLRAFVAPDSARNRWLALMLTHHLILDHTSMAILVHEVRALMADKVALLPEPLPYRNFIAQSRAASLANDREPFFTAMLGDIDEPTAPFGLLEVQADSGVIVEGRAALDPALSGSIREQARLCGVTPASLFHLAWGAVLSRITAKSSVVFGTVLFGRMRSGAGADRVVGMFINTLPIRLDIGKTPVKEAVVDAHRLLGELMAHEHTPLAQAQRCSGVAPPAPLFTSLFNYRYSPSGENEKAWPGVEMVGAVERTNYPLAMAVDDHGTGFLLTALSHPHADPHRVCRYLEQALRELVAALESPVSIPTGSLQILPPGERRLVVNEWNGKDAEFERGTLDDFFTAQARRTPRAVAVVGRDGAELTYGELDERSTRLARQLAALGVGPEGVVGVRMERSAETVIAILGILKAGGVYLPLDPAYPKERLDYMTADAGALLTLESIDGLQAEAQLPLLSDPGRLAYIIYTSGTSGKPKGVAVSHVPPVNLAFARRSSHDPIGPGDRVLAAVSVGFDVSIGQLLLPLLSGATVVIAPDVKTLGPAEFWAFLAQRHITHINSVPSFFDSILDAAPPPGALALKRIMLGGETFSGDLARRIWHALPGVEVVNMYGPTEACIDATFHVATEADLALPVLPIGRPLPNYRAYILDTGLEPVGIGIAGELCLGGAGLARGYVGAPELTSERFVPDPFTNTPGARLYRTGDRACWRADGEIEFLGRVDEQIKIRGFRVEPGEIESQMLRQPGVREAVVAYYEFGSAQVSIRESPNRSQSAAGGTRLVAYYTGEQASSVEKLRTELAAVLPDYMVPSVFVKLDQLPLSPNGKLDRRALPRDFIQPMDRAYQAPRDPAEAAIQQIFQAVLGVHPVGRSDSFFDLGGDSLAAMRLVNSVNTQFETDLPLRLLFEYPTVQSLALAVRSVSREGHSGRLVPLQPNGAEPKLFCIHPAGGHVFCYLPLTRQLGADQPVFGLQASGLEEGEPLAVSIEQMAGDYLDAILAAQPEGPYRLLGLSSGGLIAFEMARQIKQRGGEVSLLCLLDTTVPGSSSEPAFTQEFLIRAMAGELGAADLLDESRPALSLEQLVETARQASRLPPGFTLAQAERIAGVFRNVVRLHSSYAAPVYDGPVLLLRALRRLDEDNAPPDWSPYVRDGLEVVDLDCGHADFVSPAWAARVAELLVPRMN